MKTDIFNWFFNAFNNPGYYIINFITQRNEQEDERIVYAKNRQDLKEKWYLIANTYGLTKNNLTWITPVTK